VITKETTIEDLVIAVPAAVSYLMKKGIKCIACGEPIWGTLEQAAREKGFSAREIDEFVSELATLENETAPPASHNESAGPGR
jgi:iron-sulfur cluster repair protein YtfE (RIC family)